MESHSLESDLYMCGFSLTPPPPSPRENGIPRFLLAYFLKVNVPQRHFSSGIIDKGHYTTPGGCDPWSKIDLTKRLMGHS